MMKNIRVRFISLGCIIVFTFVFLASSIANAETGKLNMSYIYFGNSDLYTSRVDGTKNSINEVSPNYFDLNADGTLKLTSAVDTYFIKDMKSRGIKVIPFLSNHWDRDLGRKAVANRQALSVQIAEAIKKYNLDGINIDIENLTEIDRDDHTDFIRLLRSELPSDKTLSIAVAPNPFRLSRGWQGSYDYKSLVKYTDYIMIMAYDEHYQGGKPGPVASASFVEKSIEYALENVPKEKVVLGIPFFGRYWKNGESYGGYGVSLKDVESLVKNYRGKVEYDRTAQSVKASIIISASDNKPSLFGRKLEAGTYTIWYENEESIKYKLKLVQKYDLRGSGSWSLGQESQNTWDYYSLWLNGFYFSDAQGHWAQEFILSMALSGWMRGVSNTRFLPDNTLTRAETAAVLVRSMALDEKVNASVFKDTSGHWAEKEINIAASNNVVLGRGEGLFAPDEPVTRQEIAVMLDRALTQLGSPESERNPYKDVKPYTNPWSYDSIIKMTGYGIITGRPDGLFYPKAGATRAEMAALMGRAAAFIKKG